MSAALKLLATLLAVSSAAHAAPAGRPLLDAQHQTEWTFVTPEPRALGEVVTFGEDGVIHLSGQPLGYLQTVAPFEHYALHFEWRWSAKPGNAGVLLHIASEPIDRNLWPLCLQVQTKATRAGDLLPMAGATFAEPLSTPAGAKTPVLNRLGEANERPAGEWNTADIRCRDGSIEVRINGQLQNRVTHARPSAGRIGFQFEGAPYELRHVQLTTEP